MAIFKMHPRRLYADEKWKILYIKIHQLWYFILLLYPRTRKLNPETLFYRRTKR
jgi:hypothetical protein